MRDMTAAPKDGPPAGVTLNLNLGRALGVQAQVRAPGEAQGGRLPHSEDEASWKKPMISLAKQTITSPDWSNLVGDFRMPSQSNNNPLSLIKFASDIH